MKLVKKTTEEPTEENDNLLKDLYLKNIEDYCNVTFDSEDMPAGVALALDELIRTDPARYNIASEKLADLQISYNGNGVTGGLPAYIRFWIEPYRRVHLVGDKRKRPYNDGRR